MPKPQPAPEPEPAQTDGVLRPLRPAIDPGEPTSGGGVYGGGAPTHPPAKP